ncbi:MAG: hypothetical protein VKO39_11200 [Cyanobacteriota bacterium]|nr:hypothetical protein [Cyanobacteriota bacterium]
MPSGLRVTRIDKAPAAGPLQVAVNGRVIGALLHHTALELTVGSGELLLEILGGGPTAVFQVLAIAPGCTARVRIGRRCGLGLVHPSHYLHVDRPVLGLPDRTIHPLNLSARSALEWLQEKRALGEVLTPAQTTYLHTHLLPVHPATPRQRDTVPSLTELGAFAALGLDSEAGEAEVKEAYRLLKSIHAGGTGRSSETLLRLEEAFHVALAVLSQRVRPGVSEVGR